MTTDNSDTDVVKALHRIINSLDTPAPQREFRLQFSFDEFQGVLVAPCMFCKNLGKITFIAEEMTRMKNARVSYTCPICGCENVISFIGGVLNEINGTLKRGTIV